MDGEKRIESLDDYTPKTPKRKKLALSLIGGIIGATISGAIYGKWTDHPTIEKAIVKNEKGDAVLYLEGHPDGSYFDHLLFHNKPAKVTYEVYDNGTLVYQGLLDIKNEDPVRAIQILEDEYCDLVGKKVVFTLYDDKGAKATREVMVKGDKACIVQKTGVELSTEYKPISHEVVLLPSMVIPGENATIKILDESGNVIYQEEKEIKKPIIIDLDKIPNATMIKPDTTYKIELAIEKKRKATSEFKTRQVEVFNATLSYDNNTGTVSVTDWGVMTPRELANNTIDPKKTSPREVLGMAVADILREEGKAVVSINGTNITLQEILEMPDKVEIYKLEENHWKPEKIGEKTLVEHHGNTTDVNEKAVEEYLSQLSEAIGGFTNETFYYKDTIRGLDGKEYNIVLITNDKPARIEKRSTGVKVSFSNLDWVGVDEHAKKLAQAPHGNTVLETYTLETVNQTLKKGDTLGGESRVNKVVEGAAIIEKPKPTGFFARLAEKIGNLSMLLVNPTPDGKDNTPDIGFLLENGTIQDLQKYWEEHPEDRDENSLPPVLDAVASLVNQTDNVVITPHGILFTDGDISKLPIKAKYNAIEIGYIPTGGGGGGKTTPPSGGTGGVGGDRTGGPGVRT